jgi:hypothetical protein
MNLKCCEDLSVSMDIDETEETFEKMKRENIYFLGAGSSVFAGIPTINNFYDKAIDICNNTLEMSKDTKRTFLKF